jgi:ABC-type polysaccharide/polyol phosphate export permease
MVMLANEIYIKKIYLPKSIYVLNTCLYELTNFFLSAGTLFALGMITGAVTLSPALLTIPLVVLLLLITLIGASAILSVAGVYFRDLAYILPPIMQAAFFLTPIVYRIDILPVKAQKLMQFNPIYHLIEIFRLPITRGVLAPAESYLIACAFGFFALIFGYWLLKHFNNRIIFKL